MNRRNFLLKSALWMLGGSTGLGLFSKSAAKASIRKKTFTNPRISLIIDDFGYNFSQAKRFLALKAPITFSMLPGLEHSKDLSGYIHEKGHEIMLHQPMEPYNSNLDPGPGALYVGYGLEQTTDIIEKNIINIPFAVGINNHMGSKYTSCDTEMNFVIKTIKNNGLFFIDSLTSYDSVAYKTAKKFQVDAACRNIFLDNNPDKKAILAQLTKLKYRAERFGRAIAIGHPFSVTARAIDQFLKKLNHTTISLVPVSNILHH